MPFHVSSMFHHRFLESDHSHFLKRILCILDPPYNIDIHMYMHLLVDNVVRLFTKMIFFKHFLPRRPENNQQSMCQHVII